ncbi:MAG: cytochrome P450 [Actinomycetota bacterium]
MSTVGRDFLRFDDEYDICPASLADRSAPEQRPVLHNAARNYYAVFRHEDVIQVLRDHDLWTSVTGCGPVLIEPREQFFLMGVDPPRHTDERRLVTESFPPSAVASIGARTEQLVLELLEGLFARGEADLIEDFARLVPLHAFCWTIGAPVEDLPQLRLWARGVAQGVWPDLDEETMQRASTARAATEAYGVDLATTRQRALEFGQPVPDDLTTRLLSAAIPPEIIGFTYVRLLSAATHTTTWLIGNLIYRLLTNPDQLALLQADHSLVEAAVEESLRYDPPVRGFYRTSTEPTTLHGVEITADTKVWPSLLGANHDPQVWEMPEKFDITRPIEKLRDHCSFGYGVHRCLGAPVARLQGQIALRFLLKKLPNLRLNGEPMPSRYCRAGMGLDHLPVAWDVPETAPSPADAGAATRVDRPLEPSPSPERLSAGRRTFGLWIEHNLDRSIGEPDEDRMQRRRQGGPVVWRQYRAEGD